LAAERGCGGVLETLSDGRETHEAVLPTAQTCRCGASSPVYSASIGLGALETLQQRRDERDQLGDLRISFFGAFVIYFGESGSGSVDSFPHAFVNFFNIATE